MSPAPRHDRTCWVDVEDFFRYFADSPRPSGIQRLVFETLRVLPGRAAAKGFGRVAFVRHGNDGDLLHEVPFAAVARLFDGPRPEAGSALAKVASRPTRRPWRGLRLWLIGRIERLPPVVAGTLLEAGVAQLGVLRHARALFTALRQPRPDASPAPAPAPAAEAPRPSASSFGGRDGDLFLVLGAPWMHADYARLLRRLQAEHGIGAALLLYDLIPLRRPEWCAQSLVADFTAWLTKTLPLYSRLMAISQATARDVTAYAAEIGMTLHHPVRPVPIGTGFGATLHPDPQAEPPRGLPAPGSYVLFVSTLEARKNHALLFRVWRRLLEDLPRAQVPTLVFAGRIGWLVADLMQQLENVAWFDGKIRLLRDPTDAELAALYRGCRFTLFPSLFEGWGLPVSESLERGRPCIASNSTSLPEAGGTLARYFDPESTQDAYRVIRAVVEDADGLAAWQAQVAHDFQPVAWERTADAILEACLDDPVPPAVPVLAERVR